MAALILLLILIFSSGANAGDKWTYADTALQLTFTGLALADRSQTLQIREQGTTTEYFSVLLSQRPTHERTNRTFGVYILGHAGISYLLPKRWRTAWQASFIVFEISNINHNERIGLGARLRF